MADVLFMSMWQMKTDGFLKGVKHGSFAYNER